jgi:hypothetical protein
MSIFTKGLVTTEDFVLPEVKDFDDNSAVFILRESYDELLVIMEALYAIDMEENTFRSDFKKLEEANADIDEIEARVEKFDAVMENLVTGALGKIKEIFLSLLAKVKKFMDFVISVFMGIVMTGKKFATKYEAQIKKLAESGALAGYMYSRYEYSKLDGKISEDLFSIAESKISGAAKFGTSSTVDEFKQAKTALTEKRDEILSDIRKDLCGGDKSEDYAKCLYSHFRGGATDDKEKKELAVDINEILKTLQDSKVIEWAKATLKNADKFFKDYIDQLTQVENKIKHARSGGNESEVKGVTPGAKYTEQGEYKIDVKHFAGSENKELRNAAVAAYHALASVVSESSTVCLTYVRAWQTAVKERETVYKTICSHAFIYKKKEEKAK